MMNFYTRYSQELSVAFLVCLALAALSSLVWIMARKRKGLRISPWQIALCAALLTARLYQDPSHSGRTNAVFGTPKSDLGKTNAVFGQPSRRFLHTRFNKAA